MDDDHIGSGAAHEGVASPPVEALQLPPAYETEIRRPGPRNVLNGCIHGSLAKPEGLAVDEDRGEDLLPPWCSRDWMRLQEGVTSGKFPNVPLDVNLCTRLASDRLLCRCAITDLLWSLGHLDLRPKVQILELPRAQETGHAEKQMHRLKLRLDLRDRLQIEPP